MPWFLVSPGHQPPCYWLCSQRSLSSIGKYMNVYIYKCDVYFSRNFNTQKPQAFDISLVRPWMGIIWRHKCDFGGIYNDRLYINLWTIYIRRARILIPGNIGIHMYDNFDIQCMYVLICISYICHGSKYMHRADQSMDIYTSGHFN